MRAAPPDLPGSHKHDSPLDRALTLLLAGEREAALRWAASAVQTDATVASAIILTSRLLSEAGRTEAAREGFRLAVRRAIDAGNLPLAVAAVGDLRLLGVNVDKELDDIAEAFCADSPRLAVHGAPPPLLHAPEDFQPLSSFLAGPALLSKATEILHAAFAAYDELDPASLPPITPLPLFSALGREPLRALIAAFEMTTVAEGQFIIEEGQEGAEAFIVARGEVEVQRTREGGDEVQTITLARLSSGALFGEMALLSRAPRAASVVACRASILLMARREALEVVADQEPDVGVELAAHCRRRMVANLVRTSPVLLAVDPAERPALVERFETCVFDKGEKLIAQGSDPTGFHLVASGEVAVIARESGEPLVISTLGPGEVVGEIALVFRRKAMADVVAVHPTVTLHLPREDFAELIRAHPAILSGLYLLAVARDEETTTAAASASNLAEDYVIV